MGKFQDLTGKRFGRVLVISRAENGKHGAIRWLCLCDCGKYNTSFASGLKQGIVNSCGCLHKEVLKKIGEKRRTHGLSKSKESYAWQHMRARCYSKKNPQYKNYGARGITVCERWFSFENFLSDMGFAPSKDHSVERIDVNGNYEPGNCKWATWKEQQRNRTNNHLIEFNGETKTLAEWCELLDLNYQRTHARILKLGMAPDIAFFQEKMKTGRKAL